MSTTSCPGASSRTSRSPPSSRRRARGQGHGLAARVTALADEIHASVPDPEEARRLTGRILSGGRQLQWTDYLIARSCLSDDALRDPGERMAGDMLAIGAVRYAS